MIDAIIVVSGPALAAVVLVFPTISAYDLHLDSGDDQ